MLEIKVKLLLKAFDNILEIFTILQYPIIELSLDAHKSSLIHFFKKCLLSDIIKYKLLFEREERLFIQIRIILLVMASLRMVHNDVNDRSILLHCLSPFISLKLRHGGEGRVMLRVK